MSSWWNVVWEWTYLHQWAKLDCVYVTCNLKVLLYHICMHVNEYKRMNGPRLPTWTQKVLKIYVYFHWTVVDCGTLNTTTNGQVSHPNGTTFRQIATYSCNAGYNLVGESTHMCQADGMWSGREPTCISEPNLTVHCNLQLKGVIASYAWL